MNQVSRSSTGSILPQSVYAVGKGILENFRLSYAAMTDIYRPHCRARVMKRIKAHLIIGITCELSVHLQLWTQRMFGEMTQDMDVDIEKPSDPTSAFADFDFPNAHPRLIRVTSLIRSAIHEGDSQHAV